MEFKTLVFRLFATKGIILLFIINSFGQNALEQYVSEGLKNNLVVQAQNITLEQAENALRVARNHFLPTVQLLGDYTSGEGGRSISLPVGDLLNPVYSSLNQLTQSDAFPQIPNVDQNFFPKNFYDAKVRASIPLINTDLIINRSIKSKQLAIKDYEVKAYKRQLAFEIEEAYFKHLSSAEAVKIYEGALSLIQKNVEINESLKKNGKGLPANVMRSKSEAAKVKAELNSANNNFSNSRQYFNFLLNRELNTPIDAAYFFDHDIFPDSISVSTNQREELSMLKIGNDISASFVKMNQLNRLPKLNAFVDFGSQASDWKFDNQSQYYLFGVQLSIPLFKGFTNNIQISQSKLDLRKSELALQNAYRAIQMSADIARNDLLTAHQNFGAAKEQLKAAESYYQLIEKGYLQGVNSLIEFLDARNQLTTSELVNNVRAFDMLIAKSKLQRETASVQFEK